MSRIPVATELGRHDRFWPAVMASIAIHAAAIAVAVKASSLPTIELGQTPIRARLVRLGEKKPEQLLPQKEAPPPAAPTPAALPPVAQPEPAAPPSPAAMPAPAARPAPKAPARPATAPGKSPAAAGGVAAALARMEQQVQRDRWGDPNGDVEGDSDEGSEGDRYMALVQKALHANYTVPTTIPDKERLYLKAVVILWIEPDGHISRWKIEKPSNNPAFDDALERAIRKTSPPPPPDAQRDAYRNRGIQVTFTAGDSA